MFARTGASVGKTYKFDINDGKVYFAGFLIKGHIKENYDSQFIFLQTLTEKYSNFVRVTSMRSGQPGINSKEYQSFKFFAPSKIEQEKIGKTFNKLKTILSIQQRRRDNLKQIKQALLQKMFTDSDANPLLRYKEYNYLWKKGQLGKSGRAYSGLSGKNKNDFGHGNAYYVTYMNVYKNPIAKLNTLDKTEIDDKQNEVKYGDILFTISSETPEEVGLSSIWLGNKPNVYLNSFCFGFRPDKKVDPYYMGYMLRSPSIRKKFMTLAQGISRYNISKNKVMQMIIYFPKLNEQEKIGYLLKKLSDLIDLQQHKIDLLSQMKKWMLQNMFI